MPDHPITLTPDETRLVLALKPGETMTLTRPFPNQPPSDYTLIDKHSPMPDGRYAWIKLIDKHSPMPDGRYAWIKGLGLFCISDSPLGKPGDVLQFAQPGPYCAKTGVFPWLRLTVVSASPRLDNGVWVVDAEVKKKE